MDNYSEDDDDSYSSEQEASDDAVQAQVRALCHHFSSLQSFVDICLRQGSAIGRPQSKNTYEENGHSPAVSFLNMTQFGFCSRSFIVIYPITCISLNHLAEISSSD